MKNKAFWFKDKSDQGKKGSSKPDKGYKEIKSAPILELKLSDRKEEENYKAVLDFAMRMSDDKSDEMMTVHMDMDGNLHFNMKRDANYEKLWKDHRLMLLVSFPRNWKTMELDLDDEDDDFDIDDEYERFDHIYESGMMICID